MNIQIKIQHISFEELLISTMPALLISIYNNWTIIVHLIVFFRYQVIIKKHFFWNVSPIIQIQDGKQFTIQVFLQIYTNPSIVTHYNSSLSPMSIMNDILIIVQNHFNSVYNYEPYHHHIFAIYCSWFCIIIILCLDFYIGIIPHLM